MVETIEQQIDDDVAAYQPEDENGRFVLSTGKNTVLVDARQKVFVPVRKDEPTKYIELKNFLREVGLQYSAPSFYSN
jgi:hypothetical protein